MKVVIVLSVIGFIVGLAVMWGIVLYEIKQLKNRYYELKTEHDYLDSKYELLRTTLIKTDEVNTQVKETIGTLVELSNETTKWIQEVSPVIRRKLL